MISFDAGHMIEATDVAFKANSTADPKKVRRILRDACRKTGVSLRISAVQCWLLSQNILDEKQTN